MSGDVLVMKKTCSGGGRFQYQKCSPTRKHTRDVLTNLRVIFVEVSPTFRPIFGDAQRKIRGLICAISANANLVPRGFLSPPMLSRCTNFGSATMRQ